MALDRKVSGRTGQPVGAEGDGLDAYPTYHDGSAPNHHPTGTKPTDVDLPQSRRSYGLPMLLGLLAFGLVVVIALIMGSMNMASTSDEATTSGDPASTTSAPAASGAAPAGTDVTEPEGALDGDGQAQPSTGPGEVEAMPAPVDVPGGATTTPVQPGQ